MSKTATPAVPPATRLAELHPLLRIEQYTCYACNGWCDPTGVLHRPWNAGGTFARLLVVPCEHCGTATMFSLRFAGTAWVHEKTPRQIRADQLAQVKHMIECSAPDLCELAISSYLSTDPPRNPK